MLTADMERTAEISECGKYRWWLRRRWQEGKSVCFVMLNPSTADATQDDPTIRRCIDFAQRWGFAALEVLNLFPYRTTYPKEMRAASMRGVDIRGGERGALELVGAQRCDLIVAAWGKYPCSSRASQFLELTAPSPIYCLAKNGDGSPVHPLYQNANQRPTAFARCQGTYFP